MTSTGTCPKCGTRLFREAAGGLCPKCLGPLGFGFSPDNDSPTSPDDPLKRFRLGDYELLEEIARGGMGVVYRARQLSLNRIVAVKVVLHGPFSSAEFVRRFRTEAAAVAGLQHPNIVAIYEVGQRGGDHFFSMEYIEGQNLADAVREKPLPARRAAGYLKTVAEAVHYAHQHGVLHRDLKPSNLLLDVFDTPRVTDFGLAKLLNNDAELTTTGQVLGSPNYISPEQAAGKSGDFGPQGDVYSLGAILYHLLTGRPPFQGETLPEVLLQVHEAEPITPRRLNPSVPVDLQTICLKCLRKDPAQRYASALELAEDVRSFLANEPIRARPVGWAGRLTRWCQRKPALAATLGICGILLAVIAIGSPIALLRINRERVGANAARIRAEDAELKTQQQLYAALLEQARATVLIGEMGHRVRALDALQRAAAISNRAELRRVALAALVLPDLRFERDLPFDESFSLRSLDPKFERVALSRRGGDVEIRSTSDQSLLVTLPASTNLPTYNATEWSQDGKFLAVKRDYDGGGSLADWEVWDVANTRRVLWLRNIAWNTVSFDPKRARLLAGRPGGKVEIWELDSASQTAGYSLDGKVSCLRFAPTADRFAAIRQTEQGSLVSIHDVTTGQILCSHTFAGWVPVVAWHPDGQWLAVPEHTGAVYWMNAKNAETRRLGQHKAEANTAVFSPDGAHLFTGGWEGEIICWDAHTLRRAFTISLQAEIIKPSGDGRHYAVMTANSLRVFAFDPPDCFRNFSEDLGERLLQARFSADGRWLAASAAEQLGLWDLESHGPGALTAAGYDAYPGLTPNGSELYASRVQGDDFASFRWRIIPGVAGAAPTLERLPLYHPEGFSFLSLHSNTVAMTTEHGSQLLSPDRVSTGPEQWSPTVRGLNKISPGGRWLAINAPWSELVYIYRIPGLEPVAKLTHRSNVGQFIFSPDSSELALISQRGVQFWSTSDWQPSRLLTNFTGVLYQPNSRAIWLMKDFRAAGLYDLKTLEPLLPLPNGIRPLAVSQDGRQLAVSVDLRRLQIWDLGRLHAQLHELGLDWSE